MKVLPTIVAMSVAAVTVGCTPVEPSRNVATPPGSVPARPSASLTPTGAPSRPPPSPIELAALRGTIVYSAETDASDDIFLLTPPDGTPRRLTDGPAKEFDPALSPDGSMIAYRLNPDPARDDADIWVMGVGGRAPQNLTGAAKQSNWAPTWTPDGRIAWTSRRSGNGLLELWTMKADGSDARRVAEGWCEYAQPSPDGSSFACAAAVDSRYDIVVVDVATTQRTFLTKTPTTEFAPSWSPDGQWITFSRDMGDRWALIRIRPDGTDEQEVANEGVFSTWDPDGHLVWSGPGGIHVAHADGSDGVVLPQPGMFVSWGR